MSETGSSEQEANGGMETKITVVDGVDGLTPEMLRVRDKFARARDFTRQFQEPT